MLESTPIVGQEAIDTETGRPVWWDGIGWSYVKPTSTSRVSQSPESAYLAPPPLTIEHRPERLPLSFAQSRLWLIDQLEGTSTEYNMPEKVRMQGILNRDALQRTINAIVARHESLRTHFAVIDGQPVQIIKPELLIDLPMEDLSGLDDISRQERLTAAEQAEWVKPFDLTRGPLLRMKLFKLSEREHVLLRTFHHIVFDFWSQGVLNREFMVLYNAFHEGQQNPQKPLAVQYADFTLWQRKWLSGEALDPYLEYWKNQLSGIPEELALARDRPRGPRQTFTAGLCRKLLPESQTAALRRIAQASRSTLYMTLLSGFFVLLQRYSRQDDIVIGSPVANRQEPQLEHLIGFFVNTLALRVHVTQPASFLNLLATVRKTTLDAYMHQDLPFERLVEELSPDRSFSLSPVFQVILALQNAPVQKQQLRGLVVQAERIRGNELRIRFDLELHIWEGEAGIDLLWAYNRDLFDEWRIEQMAGHYQRLLEAALFHPELPVCQLEILTAQERQQLLVEWNGAENHSDSGHCLHRRFENLAATIPDKVALIFEDRQLTYSQLNRLANQVAHHLKRLAVGPEVRVGICLEPSLELVVGLLGTLKAGGAYVPLDPSHPPERLEHIIRDSGIRWILTQDRLQELFSPSRTTVINLDEWTAFAGEADENHENTPVPQNLVYVIYTSGSTGKPKGAEITHSNVSRLFDCTQRWFNFGHNDVWTLFHSCAFDFSVWEIWGALLYGGRLVVVPHLVSRTPEEFLNLLMKERVTVLNQTPSAFQQLMLAEERRKEHNGQELALRLIIFGGEALEFQTLRPWKQMYEERGPSLVNMYGITETTVHVTYSPITEITSRSMGSLIGQPIADLRCYVLDENMQPVPAGVAGELYVGGAGLARGYLGRPELTATRFVPNPFSSVCGTRLYRTGDLVRFQCNGILEYIGRIDHQVKVRGYRIELGEIETTLKSHKRVLDALVLLREQGEQKYLVAYVITRQSEEEQEEDQTSHLAHWQNVFESTYHDALDTGDFNIVGWNSSYTGKPIPSDEMHIWAEETVRRIRKLGGRRVLEVGCGTGLLLVRLAAEYERFVGLDFSKETLAQLEKNLRMREDLRHVELLLGLAHDLSTIEDSSVDLVILNSVAQYFPNVDYLMQVLREAVRVTRPGGHIFVGDVRSLPLLTAYHASVQLYKATDGTDVETLQQRTQQAVHEEEELVLDSMLFVELGQHWAKVRRVHRSLKAGAYDNELIRFRYDVVLEIGDNKEDIKSPQKWVSWNEDSRWREEVTTVLSQKPGSSVGVRGVRDGRVAGAVKVADYFRTHAGRHVKAQELKAIYEESAGQDPDDLIRWAESLGAEPYWQNFGDDGVYELILNPQWRHASAKCAVPGSYYRRYGNAPAQTAAIAKLGPVLQQYLRQELPEYMVPAAIMVLPAWPLTPNGKIDRKSLPAPERRSNDDYRAPRTPLEEVLCKIFAEILLLERIGLDDNFFDLGGHSLMATRLVARVRAEMGIELPLRMVFDSPTVGKLATQMDKTEKPQEALTRQRRTVNLPLSFSQQRLWFIDQLKGTSSEYNAPEAFRLRGQLDIQALCLAINTIVERHESLRTRFCQVEGEPAQVIQSTLKIDIPVEVLSALDCAGQQAKVAEALLHEWNEPFDLTRGPLLRVKLLKLGDHDHVLLRTFHHIVSDAWSLGVFNHELMVLYEAFHEGRANPLEPLPVQYADFAMWQRQILSEDSLGPHLEYWKKQLAGVPEQLALPKDRQRTSRQTYAAELYLAEMSETCLEHLKQLNQASQTTLYMSLLAAFAFLLHRYTGQEDIVIGSPVANRRETQTERLIGFFVNSLVLRVRVSPEESFRNLLWTVRSTTLESYEHQDLPFERLVEELSPRRSLNITPIYQVVFALQNAPLEKQKLQGLEIERLRGDKLRVRFDLELHASESNGGIKFSWVYNRDLFDRWRIEQLARHYLQIIQRVVEQPDIPLARLSMMNAQECSLLLEERGETGLRLDETTVMALFEVQAMESPGAIAIICKNEQVTYGELNRRANQLAHHLQKLGAGPDFPIGICVTRSVEMVLSVLAVLKAGGAYVPLDPHYPTERLTYMVDDSCVRLILTTSSQLSLMSAFKKKAVILEDYAQWSHESVRNPGSPVEAHQLAYVIYTSGSTGLPKGVGVSHANLSHSTQARMHWYARRVKRYLLLSSFAFDSSVAGLFWTLGQGGILHVPEEGAQMDVQALVNHIEREEITHILCLPFLYLEMLQEAPRKLRSLDTVIVAGESCPPELSRLHDECLPNTELYNEYGPTEATVWSTVYRHQGPGERRVVPIGRPIVNTRAYVLDQAMELVPRGVAGELYIAGAGVVRGYLNKPELTAERFLPNPFGLEAGGRLYRSGDQTQLGVDGNLEFLGRNDKQIKLRGFRIELGEIESALRSDERVQDAVVIVLEDQRLVGYVLLNSGNHADPINLRTRLKEKLPDYMVPVTIMVLPTWPLTANGKVDRRMLPMPERRSENYRPACTPQEEMLCEIFAEVLAAERVGVDDNFFDLGGHSLMATRLVNRVRATLGLELPLRTLFESPTVAELARSLKTADEFRSAPLEPQPRPARLPLSWAQRRLWFIDQMEGGSTEYNMPDALHLVGELDVRALKQAVNAIVKRHESLRTHFAEEDGEPVQVIVPSMSIDVPVEDLSGLESEEREERVRVAHRWEWDEPFDLSHGPLLRMKLLKLGEHDYILFRSFHHIVSDGWSMSIFNRELMVLYEAILTARENPLEPLPVQYADYCLWQRKWLNEEVVRQETQYWKEQLAGIPEQLGLLEDHPRPERQTFVAGLSRSHLPAESLTGLKKLGRSGNATLFMTLLSAYAVLLQRHSGQHDIVVGTPVANRREAQLEQMIGVFVNSLVMRVQMQGAESFLELLRRVRATALAAYAHQDLPFEKLVEVLSPQRALNRTPIFQVMLLLQNAPIRSQELLGLKVEPIRGQEVRAYFDLELYAGEREGRMEFTWVYNRDLFDHSRIEQMARHLIQLLESILADPTAPSSELNIFGEEERIQLLAEGNHTGVEFPQTKCVHEIFEDQVKRSPHSIAVTFEHRQLTYQQLDEKANQLGNYLRTLGVGPESLVGVCLERNLEIVVALLGILKAGGAYVPLDSDHPQERLRFMAQDAGLTVLVTQQLLLDRVPWDMDRVVCLDLDWERITQQSTGKPAKRTVSDNSAYVIYTSGSTGRPKGVVVPHGSICNQVFWMMSEFSLGISDRVLQKSSISFDASVGEIFVALSTGAELVLAGSAAFDVDHLLTLIAAQNMAYVDLPPSLLAVMLDHPEIKNCSSLKYVVCGGEALPRELWEDFRKTMKAKMYNLYGPTETTVQSTFHECSMGGGLRTVPIGKAIANTQVYLLNDAMEPVPVSALGEVYIGGTGLARGYWRRPDLTAERFLPDPFSQLSGARLYRTGDLAIRGTDGSLEFMGRTDDQVKIRGHRIELGEIEAVLNRHPKVQMAVVVARNDSTDHRRLVGYIVAGPGHTLNASELRDYLKKELPEHFRPAQFVMLERLPLTVSGKVDRRSLPPPDEPRRDTFVSPTTQFEVQLAELWSEVLDVASVGLDDNFFDLGGHSLLIARVRLKLREKLKRDVPIVDFFAFPTVRALAGRLEHSDEPESIAEDHGRASLQKKYFLRQRQTSRSQGEVAQ